MPTSVNSNVTSKMMWKFESKSEFLSLQITESNKSVSVEDQAGLNEILLKMAAMHESKTLSKLTFMINLINVAQL